MPITKKTAERELILPRSGRLIRYELERKAVKNLNLRVRRDGTIHLSVPSRTTLAAVETFLREREDWILRALAKMAARAAAHPSDGGVIDNTLPYLGGMLTLNWTQGTPAAVEADLSHRCLRIRLPDLTDGEMRAEAVHTFERAETERLVKALVAHYFPLFAARGVPEPRHIRIKDIKSRFGSCSPRTGSLNFTVRLCEYPPAFVEYVVVHELCHFLVPNHSAAFWREVERILPDRREREKLGKK